MLRTLTWNPFLVAGSWRFFDMAEWGVASVPLKQKHLTMRLSYASRGHSCRCHNQNLGRCPEGPQIRPRLQLARLREHVSAWSPGEGVIHDKDRGHVDGLMLSSPRVHVRDHQAGRFLEASPFIAGRCEQVRHRGPQELLRGEPPGRHLLQQHPRQASRGVAVPAEQTEEGLPVLPVWFREDIRREGRDERLLSPCWSRTAARTVSTSPYGLEALMSTFCELLALWLAWIWSRTVLFSKQLYMPVCTFNSKFVSLRKENN